MRRAAIIFILSTSMPLSAFAAEAGTYRAGQAYSSVTASSPAQCASQCQGDAQCKGWNFIRPRQMSRSGVCEFNARRVSPVPSPVSVSGDNASARVSSRIIPAGSRTVRVGAPTIAPMPVAAQAAAAPRRQIRAAVQSQPRPAQPVRSANPKLQYSLDGSSAGPALAASRPAAPRLNAPRLQYHLGGGAQGTVAPQQSTPSQPRQLGTQARRPAPLFQHNLDGSAPNSQASAPSSGTAPRPQNILPPAQIAQRMPIATQTPTVRRAAPSMLPAPQQSLFGSLHDDVSVPIVLGRGDIPNDPDAPIATVRSVRTIPIETTALAQLAGGPRL